MTGPVPLSALHALKAFVAVGVVLALLAGFGALGFFVSVGALRMR